MDFVSGHGFQRLGAGDALALLGRMRGFPQIAAALQVQPKLRTVAEYARKNKRRRRSDGPAVVAEFIDMLALDAHRSRERALSKPHRRDEFLGQDFADARWLALRHQHS